jgi:hypothetical protein
MSRYCIVEWPHSQRLIQQPWYYECVPYEGDSKTGSYLVPEYRTNELYGKYHRHKVYSERDELIHAHSGLSPNQYRIEFDED